MVLQKEEGEAREENQDEEAKAEGSEAEEKAAPPPPPAPKKKSAKDANKSAGASLCRLSYLEKWPIGSLWVSDWDCSISFNATSGLLNCLLCLQA